MIAFNGRPVRGFALGDTPAPTPAKDISTGNMWAEILIPTGILVLIGGVWYLAK